MTETHFSRLIGALKLELLNIRLGLKSTPQGRSAHSVLKNELGLKGSKTKVYAEALKIFNARHPGAG
jgi:hypothetical protein